MNKALFTCKNCGEKFFKKDAVKVKKGYKDIYFCPKCDSSRLIGTMLVNFDEKTFEVVVSTSLNTDDFDNKITSELEPLTKFKAGDRVFNKVTRKWVNIIEFDIETGLYIVRYDDGIQGRSLENELCETQPSFKEIKEVVKKKAEVYISSKTESDGLSKSLLYEGFVDGMMTALIEMNE